jgi:hypothetical protein
MIDPRDADRDRIWCKALVSTLGVDDIYRVTTEFLRLRNEVAVEQLAEADRAKVFVEALDDLRLHAIELDVAPGWTSVPTVEWKSAMDRVADAGAWSGPAA